MLLLGIIGIDSLVTEYVFTFFVKRFGYKGIKLVDCNQNCYLVQKTVVELDTTNKLDSNLNIIENYNELLVKKICFCGSEKGKPYEDCIKFRAKKALMVATSDLNSSFIISRITNEIEMDIFSNTFFVSLAIDTPLISRFNMKVEEHSNENDKENEKTVDILKRCPEKLSKLVSLLQQDLDEKKTGIYKLIKKSDYFICYFEDFSDLGAKLLNFGLTKINLRPNWDEYFMEIAKLASKRSNCISRKVGSVIVRGKKIISTGYNGTPKNMKNCFEGGCCRCSDPNRVEGKSLETCSCMHAEANAILFAGIDKCIGATMYVTLMPCISCTKNIIQCEIERVVFTADYAIPDNISTIKLLTDSNIKVDRLLEKQSCL